MNRGLRISFWVLIAALAVGYVGLKQHNAALSGEVAK